jgi:hypothetical protein
MNPLWKRKSVAIVRNVLVDDSNDTEKSTEIDDLASFGPLRSPDTEDSGFATEADPAETDLTSLASSAKTNQNGYPEPLSTEDDSRVDLSQAADAMVEETGSLQETASEHVEQPPDASAEQPTPVADRDVQERSEPERADQNGSNKGQTHWVSMLSVGFILGLTTASISIFIFINMDRFQSNDPVSASSTPIVQNQHAAMPPRTSRPLDLSNSQRPPPQSAQPEHANTVVRPGSPFSDRRLSSRTTGRRASTSIRTRERAKKPIDQKVETLALAEAASQPISTPDGTDRSVDDKPTNPATTTGVASSTKKPQPTAATTDDLDKIIDRVLDATEVNNIKRSVARKESQKNAPKPPEELPLAPSREQVTEAMAVLLPAIRGCAKGLSGLATANIIVLNSGKVANVTVYGSPFAGTASGHCIEGVIRKARFPRFRQPSFRIQFPLSIRNVPQ